MKARICSTAPRTSADNTGEVRAVSTEGVRGKHSTKMGLPFTESGVVTCSIRCSIHSAKSGHSRRQALIKPIERSFTVESAS
jgi:hypothetical protein